MLVILSDVHLTDESTAVNVHGTAFSGVLSPEILSVASRKDAKEIHVVLLGDIFDLVRTDYWVKLKREERPWNGDLSDDTGMNRHPNLEQHYQNVLDQIICTPSSKQFFETLDSLKPQIKKLSGVEIPLKITYVVGNHDRAFNNFPSLQQNIRSQFKNIDDFDLANHARLEDYGVLARHGHEWDVNNYGYEFFRKVLHKKAKVDRFDKLCYEVQTIGEVITAELMSGLIYRINESSEITDRLGDCIKHTNPVKQLMQINNIRPMTDVLLWLEWFGRNALDKKTKAALMEKLKDSLREALNTQLSKMWDKLIPEIWILKGDLTDRLEQVVEFIGNKDFDELKRGVDFYKFFHKLFGRDSDDFMKGAEQEWKSGLPPEIQYIVYGHTHEHKHSCFEGNVDGNVKMYINTGTYLPLIQCACKNGFSSAHQMTIALFYRPDEDVSDKVGNAPTVDIWYGIKRKAYRC